MAMALVVSGHLWIEANFTETDLTYVLPGQPVKIHIDTYPDAAWNGGTVESLSPATGAEFSVIPAQNATGNWVKIAQRVPVRIKLDTANAGQAQTRLRAGLSTLVEIDTGHRRHSLRMLELARFEAKSMTAATTAANPESAHRGFITASVMLATIMQALDTTIANVALPHMQGTMGATQDQISWVLTSYIVAAAIFMPLTGFLTARLGRKRMSSCGRWSASPSPRCCAARRRA